MFVYFILFFLCRGAVKAIGKLLTLFSSNLLIGQAMSISNQYIALKQRTPKVFTRDYMVKIEVAVSEICAEIII